MGECLGNMSMRELLGELSSASPAPGGGSASALAGAMGAALVSMVAALSNRGGEAAMLWQESRERLGAVLEALLSLADRDAEAFSGVIEALRFDGDKHEGKRRIREATIRAISVPLEVAHLCASVIEEAGRAVRRGNPNAASDAGVGLLLALAGLQGAALNVKINLASLKDPELAKRYEEELERVMPGARALAESLLEEVRNRLV